MRSLSIFCIVMLVWGNAVLGQSPKFYFLSCIDNVNEDVRSGCAKDYEKALMLFKAIAADAKMEFENVKIPFGSEQMNQILNNFHCSEEDVVVFLFSGHGFRYEQDGEELPWPYAYLCQRAPGQPIETDGSCEFDLDEVQTIIQNANPRMSVILADCCNDVIDNAAINSDLSRFYKELETTAEEESAEESNMALFTDFRGHIIASAASPGEGGITNDDEGSHFSNAFLGNLYEAIQPNAAPASWEKILNQTKNVVKEIAPGQTPLFWIQN